MAYFNHSFQKMFLGTEAGSPGGLDQGFIASAGVASHNIKSLYGVGAFGMFDPSTYLTVASGSTPTTTGKPLILASSSLYQHDKVGPFNGGYQESNKSKLINPKYISKFYRVDPCSGQANIVHVGRTAYTTGLSPDPAGCCHEFVCDKTYYLRLDVKGSPVLRYLTRNAYWTADYYTGCCDVNGTENSVDPTLVMIGWATGLLGQGTVGDANYIPNVITGPFIQITVTDFEGNVWYQPGTNGGVDEWDDYVSTWDPDTDSCATATGGGMTITGSYVDTVFGDCTFYPSDFFQKEPVHIYASEVDNLGNPCVFTGICVDEQCAPKQASGFGETVLRELILSESYQQNYFNTNMDLRIREITQGYDISDSVVRASTQYYRYCILHSVPRFNNPTGVFDNDQYLLTIVTNGISTGFQTFMAAWLGACGCNTTLEIAGCGSTCVAQS